MKRFPQRRRSRPLRPRPLPRPISLRFGGCSSLLRSACVLQGRGGFDFARRALRISSKRSRPSSPRPRPRPRPGLGPCPRLRPRSALAGVRASSCLWARAVAFAACAHRATSCRRRHASAGGLTLAAAVAISSRAGRAFSAATRIGTSTCAADATWSVFEAQGRNIVRNITTHEHITLHRSIHTYLTKL